MSSDLDTILRDLEKQVHDFSLTMDPPIPINTHIRRSPSSRLTNPDKGSNPNRPLQSAHTMHVPPITQARLNRPDFSPSLSEDEDKGQFYSTNDANDSSDDDVCIANLQSVTRAQDDKSKGMTRSRSTRANRGGMAGGLVRSASASSRTYKPPAPEESAPPLPIRDTDEDLNLVIQRAWALYEQGPYDEPVAVESAPSVLPETYLRKKGLIDMSEGWALFEIANSHGVERPLREWELVLEVVECWGPDANNALLVKKYAYHNSLTAEGKWQKRFCYIKDNAIHHAKDTKGNGSAILCYLATFDVYTLLPQQSRSAPSGYVFALRAQDKDSIFEREEDYMRLLAVEDQEAMKDWVLSIRCTKSLIDHQYHPQRVINPLAPIQAPVQASYDHQWSATDNSVKPADPVDAGSPRLRRALTSRTPDCKSDQSGDEGYGTTSFLRRQKSTRDVKPATLVDEHTKHQQTSSSGLHRSESSRRIDEKRGRGLSRGLSRSTTMRGREEGGLGSAIPDSPLIDYTEPSTFAKGSLLGKDGEEHTTGRLQDDAHAASVAAANNTLIQINDKVKFSKGSLLERNESTHAKIGRSKSTREHHAPPSSSSVSSAAAAASSSVATASASASSAADTQPTNELRQHMSLRRKLTSSKDRERSRHHENLAPTMPSSSPSSSNVSATASPVLGATVSGGIAPSATSHGPLLQLDGTPEQIHTKKLLGRQMKPLLNFADSDDKGRR
ncbi:hypothetical protein PHYBLDRAFT_187479 [Phycomyces blakesleeanus NRRL 1555(-)]|uniref:Uncharacterized protein n=1 Tax=Phycomyces blakesleeanus (strain ATCC 8743b / DSM 1359 / FGSC 10004 / NBRC 33097 / NRRL 1555) TaxID=763407 RepID=A0A162U3A2_PHYB8|nr:hypothetical protein PHYBLDRAFT_187479 [Phycomyces blakesleeanus NRRL 1555(-)]OAD72033.1 hypothetical protein PHYBLDRAFT_187479 [Phycomyces blakesleeanus NRRL 1555(-)]|eukprot:XP_018290073.1 hypothetical protein PHYBLDRAFT_187479 [Phycomyces blakesleeanus NRRL 1555(-)]